MRPARLSSSDQVGGRAVIEPFHDQRFSTAVQQQPVTTAVFRVVPSLIRRLTVCLPSSLNVPPVGSGDNRSSPVVADHARERISKNCLATCIPILTDDRLIGESFCLSLSPCTSIQEIANDVDGF